LSIGVGWSTESRMAKSSGLSTTAVTSKRRSPSGDWVYIPSSLRDRCFLRGTDFRRAS
jgi:hypothetical protein